MKHFIKKLLTFLLPLILLSYPIDLGISYLLQQKEKVFAGELEVWKDIYNSNINCDIAIVGSSRAWVQINPEILKDSLKLSTYNFGIDGHNFWLQYLRHSEYLKYNKKPKLIIVSVDLFTLEKRIDLYKHSQFLPYMLWNKEIYKFTISYKGFNKIDYYIPLVRYFGERTSLNYSLSKLFSKNNNEKLRNNGFAGKNKQWNSDLEKAKKEKGQLIIDIDKETIRLFKSFVKECKRNGTELILVYTPEYIEGQCFVSNRKDIINIYKDISYKENVAFYDYSNDSICFNKTLFYNASHLNMKGANIFTQKLAHDVKKYKNTNNIH